MGYIILLLMMSAAALHSEILTVGTGGDGYDYDYLQQACSAAQPGDTIVVFNTGGSDGEWIENLKGMQDKWISIIAYEPGKVEYKGNSEAWHLVDAQYVYVHGFVFSGQTGNGVNADDGGSYGTPSKYLVFDNCTWKDMNATGNNDQLKMSGVDYFTIKNCRFENGSAGGSQIDMVGCHLGVIENSKFINGGSNAIQAKGGSSEVIIQRNWFENSGQRAINIGGSTGAEFFRPVDADYESKQIAVFANYFIGSVAPIAFVGTVNSAVIHNTIITPGKWAIRILQENTGKQTCSGNMFVNNIVYLTNASVNPVINIGPNTAPETFMFANNLWYNKDNTQWAGPDLPAPETAGIYQTDPQFADETNYRISESSPAAGKGLNIAGLISAGIMYADYGGAQYNNPPSVGAWEGNPPGNSAEEKPPVGLFRLEPSPADENSLLVWDYSPNEISAEIYDLSGTNVISKGMQLNGSSGSARLQEIFGGATVSTGLYILHLEINGHITAIPFIYIRK